jgi:hypothetical protein
MTENVETWSGKDRADENFPVGSALIAPRLRPHMHAFYAFARNADDIADSPTLPADDKIRRLDVMESVLLGHTEAGSPSATGLRASLAQTGVTPRHATDLLIAFRRDATKLRYENWDELLDYCRYSAMPVGRHVLDLHGESRDTWPASDALCAALQVPISAPPAPPPACAASSMLCLTNATPSTAPPPISPNARAIAACVSRPPSSSPSPAASPPACAAATPSPVA